ncbi:MAG TPA: DUF2490 domain-containing protein [Spirochaetota bacterium]|nr:DUF2490 domain-containing protein [Spirochaetota bacterium]
MIKRLALLFVLVFVLCTSANVFAVPVAYRSWTYLDLTALLSPQWSYTLLTSHSYEYERKNDPGKEEKKTFFYEVFTGPTYTMRFDNLTVKLPLWYYYQSFPTRAAVSPTGKDEHYYSHNIEFLPIIEYKIGNLKLWNRIIFHNKVYSTYPSYTTSSLKKGYSLLIREYFRIEYSITDQFAVMIGDEIFQGIIDDEDTKDITKAPLTPGFEYGGFSQNRLYVGFSYKFTPTIILTPMYMYQTQYFKTGNKLTEKDHYLFTTLTFLFKTYE